MSMHLEIIHIWVLRRATATELTIEDIRSNKVVRHHEHVPSYKFQGFAHSNCNIHASAPPTLPIVFHNLKGYDSHFLVKSAKSDIIESMEIIPQSSEKYMSIIINKQIKFIDSFMFLNSSLASLVDQLDKATDFVNTRHEFSTWKGKAVSDEQLNLLYQKGAYPYSYMDSVEKFKVTSLPPKEVFKCDLTGKDIDDKVYENAQKVWEAFEIQDMGEWHDLYVMLDVALLCDVFAKLRYVLYDAYGLDVSHYFSLPMYSMDAALKFTGVELEYIKDPTMYNWFEGAIRGGLCSVGDIRAAKANNPYLPDYKPDEETSYLAYLDANNLYGGALSKPLPRAGFEWVDVREMTVKINNYNKQRNLPDRKGIYGTSFADKVSQYVSQMKEDAEEGMFFEVDLSIPLELHDKFNAYPPAPYKRSVNEHELSPFQKEMAHDLGIKTENVSKQPRLIADLNDKKEYICDYRILQMYLKLGVKITKFHRAVQFEQTCWMKKYVDENTRRRTLASERKDKIEVSFWKLMNNTGYGKLIENKRDRTRMVLVKDREKALFYNRKPTFSGFKILRDDLVLLTLKKLQVTLDRPIAAGIACLELSKMTMFDFHYNYMGEKYPGKHKLLYTDTDSFIYKIYTEDFYKDCKTNEENFFDMSDYNKEDPVLGSFASMKNHKKLLMFKDEVPEGILSEVVISKPKMYACKVWRTDGTGYEYKKRAKGISTHVVRTELTYEDYVNTFKDGRQQIHKKMKTIRAYNHNIYNIEMRKKALNGYDVKRFVRSNGIDTFAFGHTDIPSVVLV